MPIEFLTLVKFFLLLLIYVFLARTVRVVVTDIHGPRRKSRSRRPVATSAPDTRRSRKNPKEIVVHAMHGAPNVVPLNGRLVLGRADHADVIVEDVYISDEHAEILADGGGWSVRDLGSTNGTFLNGARVGRPTPLAAGDQLRIGKTRIEVRR
ncbi:MAG: FHA domain-containing protein [Nitriliruptoraceae bacterium]